MKANFRRPLRLLLLAASFALASRGATPANAQPDETIALPKLSIKGSPICSYGVGVAGLRDPHTKKIKRLFVEDVTEDSEAQRQGIQTGDEILSINGVKVAGMDGYMKPGAQLFDLLINQAPGQTIKLEVVVHSTKTVTLKTRF